MPNTYVPVNPTGLPADQPTVSALPPRMTVATEFLQLMDLRGRVERRLDELTVIVERNDPHDVVLLPKSGMRLRAVRSGGFLFDGGRRNG